LEELTPIPDSTFVGTVAILVPGAYFLAASRTYVMALFSETSDS